MEELIVLEWFKICQTQWNRAAGFFGERRVGIPFSDAEIAAQRIGLRLNNKRFNMFIECVQTIVNDDVEVLREREASSKKK